MVFDTEKEGNSQGERVVKGYPNLDDNFEK